MKADNRVRTLATGGVFAALIAALTFFSFPLPAGYAHAGDGAIYLSAILMGPAAFAPAAIGSALTDLMLGFGVYAPATLVIKGAMGFLAGKFLQSGKKATRALALAGCSLLMIGGYFLYDSLIYSPSAALASLPGNVVQGAVGALLGVAALALEKYLPQAIRRKRS